MCILRLLILFSFLFLSLKLLEIFVGSIWWPWHSGAYLKEINSALKRWKSHNKVNQKEFHHILKANKRMYHPEDWPIRGVILKYFPKSVGEFVTRRIFRFTALFYLNLVLITFLPSNETIYIVIGIVVLITSIWIEVVHMMTNRFVFGFADTYFLKICIQYKYPHSAPELNDFFPSRTEMLRDFGKMFFWTINIIVFGYTVIYFSIDQIMNPAFTNIDETSKIMRILDLFYFTITTFATVGYGDIVPCPSTILRLVVASQMVAVFLIVVALLSAFTATIESSE